MSDLLFNPIAATIADSFSGLIMVSAIGSLIVIAAMLLHALISRFVSARWMYLLWLVVMLRFVAFVGPESPTSFLNLIPDSSERIAVSELKVESLQPLEKQTNRSIEFNSDTNGSFETPIQFDNPSQTKTASSFSYSSLQNIWAIALIVWSIGVIVMLFRLSTGFRKVRRIMRSSMAPTRKLQLAFGDVHKHIGIKSKVKLRITSEIEIPSMAGFVFPVVLLPLWCAEELDADQLNLIFAHELIHVRRRDGLIQLLTHLIVVLHWFNPLARAAANFAGSARELSCDRRVVDLFAQNEPTIRNDIARRYGKTILDIATHVSRNATSKPLSPVILGGFIGSNQKLIKQRIAMIVKTNSKQKFASAFAVASIVLFVAVGFTKAQTSEQEKNPATKDAVHKPAVPLDNSRDVLPVPAAMGQTYPNPQLYSLSADQKLDSKQFRNHSQPYRISIGESQTIEFPCPVSNLSFTTPDIASATKTASPASWTLEGVGCGTSVVLAYFDGHKAQMMKVIVTPDVSDLQSKIKTAFPESQISVYGTQDGFAVLTGRVKTEQVLEIETFAAANTTLPLKNQLTDKDFVAVKVHVYAVDLSKISEIDFDWSLICDDIEQPITSVRQLLDDVRGNMKRMTQQQADVLLQYFELLQTRGAAKLLNQPTLLATDGGEANFLHGGEIPIAFEEDGETKVEFRTFGTKIDLVPKIQSANSILLETRVEVSEVAKDLADSHGVPGFRVRRLNLGADLKPGASMVLVEDWRTNEESGEDSELIFILTPRLIDQQTVLGEPVLNQQLRR